MNKIINLALAIIISSLLSVSAERNIVNIKDKTEPKMQLTAAGLSILERDAVVRRIKLQSEISDSTITLKGYDPIKDEYFTINLPRKDLLISSNFAARITKVKNSVSYEPYEIIEFIKLTLTKTNIKTIKQMLEGSSKPTHTLLALESKQIKDISYRIDIYIRN